MMQRLKDKLLPCPNCRRRAPMIKIKELTNGTSGVCIICMCGHGVYAPTAHEAVERWNERREGIDEQRKADKDEHI